MSETTFEGEFNWQRQFVLHFKRFIGPHLLRESTLEEDREEATDLITLRADGVRIGCRLRRPGYAKPPWDRQVTFTCERETRAKCEWDTMILGNWGDLFCYGHATDESAVVAQLKPAYLIDLALTRAYIRDNHGPKLGPNKDAVGVRCWFYAIDVDPMIAECGIDALMAARWPHGRYPVPWAPPAHQRR